MRTDVMLQTTTISAGAPYLERANDLYDIATECWTTEAHVLYYGTAVEKEFFTDSVSIIARWKPITGKSTDPIIKITITPRDEGSVARIFEREHPFITKGNYAEDAIRWLNGLYSCI